jgi:signal peptidase I
MLREDYITEKNAGVSDIEYPFTVPDGTYFVLGDNRYMSIDSRVSQVGCVEKSLIAGKLIIRVWPFNRIGLIK